MKKRSLENRKGRETWKRELISTNGSNYRMINPSGLSRIQNLYDHALSSIRI
jgi:hypothetical protein